MINNELHQINEESKDIFESSLDEMDDFAIPRFVRSDFIVRPLENNAIIFQPEFSYISDSST